MSKSLRLAGFSGAILLAVSSQAFAHGHLATSVPADKSAVAAPAELDLTFTEALNLQFSGLSVTGPDKQAVKLGTGALNGDDKMLVVPVIAKLTPGAYTVEWHVLSVDGHKTNGTYDFTVKP